MIFKNGLLKDKVRGNALIITVIISLIIGLLCSFLILLYYNNLQLRVNANSNAKLDRNLQSAINLFLTDSGVVSENQERFFDLFGEGNDSIGIAKETWGIFNFAKVIAFDNQRRKSKNFFYGPLLQERFNACLYLVDHQRPLSLVGNTNLIGNAYLPRAGVTSSFINQQGYTNKNLISGKVENSAASLPNLDERVTQNLFRLLNMSRKGELGSGYQLALPDSLSVSFSDSVIIAHIKNSIYISGNKLKGHIVIISDSKIVVANNARLEDIILVAPVIKFQNGFSGTVQALTTDSLVVGSNCNFNYPSVLILKKRPSDLDQPHILIADHSVLDGILITLANQEDKNKILVEVRGGSIVTGIIYVCGYLDLNGLVNGIVLTDYFLHRTATTIYENYLVDAGINSVQLSKYFAIPRIFEGGGQNKILQWVE